MTVPRPVKAPDFDHLHGQIMIARGGSTKHRQQIILVDQNRLDAHRLDRIQHQQQALSQRETIADRASTADDQVEWGHQTGACRTGGRREVPLGQPDRQIESLTGNRLCHGFLVPGRRYGRGVD